MISETVCTVLPKLCANKLAPQLWIMHALLLLGLKLGLLIIAHYIYLLHLPYNLFTNVLKSYCTIYGREGLQSAESFKLRWSKVDIGQHMKKHFFKHFRNLLVTD